MIEWVAHQRVSFGNKHFKPTWSRQFEKLDFNLCTSLGPPHADGAGMDSPCKVIANPLSGGFWTGFLQIVPNWIQLTFSVLVTISITISWLVCWYNFPTLNTPALSPLTAVLASNTDDALDRVSSTWAWQAADLVPIRHSTQFCINVRFAWGKSSPCNSPHSCQNCWRNRLGLSQGHHSQADVAGWWVII